VAIQHYPGNLRIGVLDGTPKASVSTAPHRAVPKVKVLVLLSGFHRFMVNAQTVDLDASEHPAAVTLTLPDGGQICHLERRGEPYRKLAIAADWDWFEAFTALETPENPFKRSAEDALANLWRPDQEVVRLATQIVLPPPMRSAAEVELYRMARGTDILRRVAGAVAGGAAHSPENIAESIRQTLVQSPRNNRVVEELEASLGLSQRSLQRHFKQAFGLTIAGYQRHLLLQLGHRALCEDGVSIAEAASLAGYSSTANFTTAFRRAYGVTPKVLQRGA